jgi:hypothetical protein
MFAVIYRFQLQPEQEEEYQKLWRKIACYFVEKRGAIGSCLHKGADGLWVAYSRWPDKITRDASWPSDDAPNDELPNDVKDIITSMQAIKQANKDLPQYDEICLDVIEDLCFQNSR